MGRNARMKELLSKVDTPSSWWSTVLRWLKQLYDKLGAQ